MKSLQNGLLATVVRGNRHSLQTAHQALQREKERHTESDSVVEGWPWQNNRFLLLHGFGGNIIFVSIRVLDSSFTIMSQFSSYNGSWKAHFYSQSSGSACLAGWFSFQAQTPTEIWPISTSLIQSVYSHTCTNQTLTTAWTSPVIHSKHHPPTFTHCHLLLILKQSMQAGTQFEENYELSVWEFVITSAI